jgi:UDP-2-acetamido-3-amino-2,3-dideoxy-glucuronate N-acetyltransferase
VAPIDLTAEVSALASIDVTTTVWGLAQIRERAHVGRECTISRGVYVDIGVRIGDRVKIQNFAQIYEPAEVGNGVFIGPAAVLTNDQYPRAVTPTGELASRSDWTSVGVTVREGASIGARAVCVAPLVIGRWAMVAAGATVVHDVPDFALVAGTPARRIGWVGKSGRRLVRDESGQPGQWMCPVTGERFQESDEVLVEVQP